MPNMTVHSAVRELFKEVLLVSGLVNLVERLLLVVLILFLLLLLLLLDQPFVV
ncbi:Uncharacterised protein [Mycobacteroides abscessus subsp. abscessus]|nr:Uncharacterised protein [Mycobacteroides abscessus subsp. abscessus]